MGRPTSETRKTAAQRAAQEWVSSNGGNDSQASRKAAERGITISQQVFGWARRGQKLGEQTIDRLAALYETTPDGLVAKFVGNVGAVRFRDTQGFASALAEAMEERGDKIDPWVWDTIGDVVLPARPRAATVEMVLQLANFLDSGRRI